MVRPHVEEEGHKFSLRVELFTPIMDFVREVAPLGRSIGQGRRSLPRKWGMESGPQVGELYL